MSTLLLRLAAPMQAWGVGSKFDTRSTQKEPTKSGVLGLLAAAIGIRRDNAAELKSLSRMRFGVRIDREGKLLEDFHMAHGEKSDYVTRRFYLCDAVFLCGLESENEEILIQHEYALMHPVYPLFLGRRSCPPTLPLVLGIRDCELETALRAEPQLVMTGDAVRIVLDSPAAEKGFAVEKDAPISFNPRRREFGYRKCREIILSGTKRTEHDPFAEVEAENVPDAYGT